MAAEKTFTYTPFRKLKGSLTGMPVHSTPETVFEKPEESVKKECEEFDEELLFRSAMEGVQPLEKEGLRAGEERQTTQQSQVLFREDDDMSPLVELVERGVGFVVADTPEYMEGTGFGMPVEFAKRLHRGDFSIQGHIDLHGLSAREAREVFDAFLREAIAAGKRAVLIVHGRGLSSVDEPVLKNKVSQWLTSRHWRKWLIAYASARGCDGGAGATYVLLRNRPAVVRPRRKRHERP